MTDAELLAEIEAVKPKASRGEALGRGVAQGVTLGFGDEIAALLSALPGPTQAPDGPIINTPAGDTFGERYRNARDPERAANEAAREAYPKTYMAGQIVASLPAVALTGGALPAVAGQGAAQGAGYSEHEGLRLLGDSALGAAGGLAGHGAGKLLGKAAQGVLRLATQKTGAAAQKAGELATKKVEKELASLRGAYGGARQNESRAIEVLLRAEATGALTPQQAAQLATLKASPEWAATIQNVAQNYMDDFAGMAGATTGARASFQTAAQNVAKDTAAEKARVLSGAMAKEQIKARLQRYGPMGVAGALAGSTLGGTGGALLGGAAGAAVRPMLHALRRAGTHPSVQNAMWTPVQRAATAATSPTANVLRQSLARAGATPLAPDAAEGLGDYLRKSRAEREAEAELARLLAD